ncbi:MAG: Flagellar basal body rod protein FlgB [Desulfotomaculum sp. 46_296]|nr:MAG: Flagellar basal body rod protein FlgB [Desulfotomaculum sp. 46_296]HAU32303.1 flagellar basal body rod protein FlgB [Desulfotomaculum sp.]
MPLFENDNIVLLAKYLNVASMRQKLIAHNIANISTPGYKSLTLRFEDCLQDALNPDKVNLGTSREEHISNIPDANKLEPFVEKDNTSGMRADANNVNLEHEMTVLSANTIQYNLVMQRLTDNLQQLSYVITSRGR